MNWKDVEGNGCDLPKGTIIAFAGGTEKVHKNISQDS
jgi:hypothetical protein